MLFKGGPVLCCAEGRGIPCTLEEFSQWGILYGCHVYPHPWCTLHTLVGWRRDVFFGTPHGLLGSSLHLRGEYFEAWLVVSLLPILWSVNTLHFLCHFGVIFPSCTYRPLLLCSIGCLVSYCVGCSHDRVSFAASAYSLSVLSSLCTCDGCVANTLRGWIYLYLVS